jgi:hypothetical protein
MAGEKDSAMILNGYLFCLQEEEEEEEAFLSLH